ncbi:peptide ABC transporter substrate-binding protein [Clostridium boliviensis]|uniref:Peptide ABC transporter substrate-binding protein n=1 Tax=Clostridium boliviensis TaxID=318465 RepID=A0ABU4GIB9_9CLOT|nr:peptide ABC transporter substrate-binding protein [Clostridium boliviensis]MDW2797357.1 peptide ABC transporter substrate-binding protein [Clostridium boliviensis]
MKLRRFFSVLMAAGLVASSLAGCGGSAGTSAGGDNADTQKTAENGKKGPNGETLAAEQVAHGMQFHVVTFDTAQAGDSESGSFFLATCEGLFRENKGVLENTGCEKYEISDDGLTYTFHLRKNKWSDGVEVVASQYKDAVERVLNVDLACPYAFFAFPIKNAENYYNGKCGFDEVGVEAVDDYTLKFTLEAPEPYFIDKLAYTMFDPIRVDNIEKYGDTYGTDAMQVLSCGPYMVQEYTASQSTVLVKNPEYWDAEHVYLDEIDLQQIDETATQFQLFEAGQLDFVPASGDYLKKWDEAASEGKCQLYIDKDVSTQYFAFNTQESCPSGLMQNAKIRKAVAYTFDSQTFIDSVYNSRYTAAYGLVTPNIKVGDKEYRSEVAEPIKEEYSEYANNPEKLKALFHEGLKELGKDTDDLSTITLQFLGYGETTIEKDIEQYVVQRIQDNLGVKVKLNIVGDFGLANAAQLAGEFDLCMLGWGADYNDPMTFIDIFRTGGGSNYGKYSSEKYDQILDQLATEQDNDKRMKLYGEAESILIRDDAAIKPLLYRDKHSYINNRFHNFQYPVFGGKYEFKYAYIVEE